MSTDLPKRIFVLSLVFLLIAIPFGYGLAVGQFQIWPYEPIKLAWNAALSIKKFGKVVPEDRRVRAPPGAERQVFTVLDPAHMSDGYYVFGVWDDEKQLYGARLYDDKGKLLHTWVWNYDALDPDGPLNGSDAPHAFHVLPDGSVIVGFDKGDIMVRLDYCGRPIWTKHGVYHHAVTRDDDGNFWTWHGEHTPYAQYQYIQKFDAKTGKKIREIGLVEDIIRKMGPQAVIFGVRPDYPFQHFDHTPEDETTDLFHPNDVDVLTADLAPKFPMFKAGDLLLSFRTINLVTVNDPETGRVKWWSTGPWIGQHDPDFAPDGKISVFDNNTDRGRSEIIKIDPATRAISNDLFYGNARFFSDYQGKEQYLPNGNILIVVPDQGRILEVTSTGQKVMEYDNVVSPDYNEHVYNGMWVPLNYFQRFPQCTN